MGGTGAELPGFLGLKSLESLRAALDMGRQQLILPGGGEPEITWPPGTIIVPLDRAPSGHNVMTIDAYERVVQDARGGVPDRSLQLRSRAGDSETEDDPDGLRAVTAPQAEADMRAHFGPQ